MPWAHHPLSPTWRHLQSWFVTVLPAEKKFFLYPSPPFLIPAPTFRPEKPQQLTWARLPRIHVQVTKQKPPPTSISDKETVPVPSQPVWFFFLTPFNLFFQRLCGTARYPPNVRRDRTPPPPSTVVGLGHFFFPFPIPPLPVGLCPAGERPGTPGKGFGDLMLHAVSVSAAREIVFWLVLWSFELLPAPS